MRIFVHQRILTSHTHIIVCMGMDIEFRIYAIYSTSVCVCMCVVEVRSRCSRVPKRAKIIQCLASVLLGPHFYVLLLFYAIIIAFGIPVLSYSFLSSSLGRTDY